MGKIIGAALGFFITHTIYGAILGFFIGALFDFIAGRVVIRGNFTFQSGIDSIHTHLPLLTAFICRTDGSDREGVLRVKTLFLELYTVDAARRKMEIFKGYCLDGIDNGELFRVCMEINNTLTFNEKSYLISLLAAAAGNRMTPGLSEILKLIGADIGDYYYRGGSSGEYERENGFGTVQKGKAAYATLGIEEEASVDEIKKKYRQLCKIYHPDKAATKSRDEQLESEKKMREINAAYEILKREKNFR